MGKRMADILALHQMNLSTDEILRGRFVAIRLSDGGSNGHVYENRSDAIQDQHNSLSRHAYIQIPLERLSPETCCVLLWYQRSVYDAGHREDPAHALIVPNNIEDLHL